MHYLFYMSFLSIFLGAASCLASPLVAHDCLAGEKPPSVNMHKNELHERHWITQREEHQAGMDNAPDGHILFIGDSMLHQCKKQLKERMPNSYNAAIRGESSRQLLYRLGADVNQNSLIHRAGALVIMTFVNDLGDSRTWKNGETGVRNLFGTYLVPYLAHWVSGNVILIKVLYNNLRLLEKRSDFNSVGVRIVNEEIDRHFGKKSSVAILDLNPKLSAQYPDGTTHLSQRYTNDGIHLNVIGCNILASEVAELVSR